MTQAFRCNCGKHVLDIVDVPGIDPTVYLPFKRPVRVSCGCTKVVDLITRNRTLTLNLGGLIKYEVIGLNRA